MNKMSNEIIKNIIDTIQQYQTIIIHRHLRPDGDCIGTSLGLREVLRNSFPDKKVYSVGGEMPDFLKFLGSEDIIDDSMYKDALAIVVDTAVSDRIVDERFKLAKQIIKIDHHIVIDNYGSINYVEEEAGACSLLITKMCMEFPNILKINKEAARYLYTAFVTDTGRFSFGIDGDTLRQIGFLLDQGIDIQTIYVNLYTKEKEDLKFYGWLYDNFEVTENGVAYIYIDKDVKKKFKMSNEEASATVSKLDSIKGSLIWILFNEQDEEIRVRLRSRYIGVDKLANNYRGGGHENASGATVYSKDEAMKLISEADALLKEFKKQNGDKF